MRVSKSTAQPFRISLKAGPRRSRYLFFGFILLATLGVAPFTISSLNVTTAVYFGLIFSLATMIAFQFCIVRNPIRYLVAPFALLASGLLFLINPAPTIAVLLPATCALPIISTLEFVKFSLGSFQQVSHGADKSFSEGLQFSIMQLLILTTAVAAIIGLGSKLVPTINFYLSERLLRLFIEFAAILSALTFLTIWSLLGHLRVWKIVVALLIGKAMLWIRGFYADVPSPLISATYVVAWVNQIMFTICLRFDGFRFVKKQSNSNADRH